MNDVERELRELLERKAGSVGGVAPRLPETVRKRGRRRQAGTAAIGAFTVAAVALVSFAGLRAIDFGDADGGVPADDPWAGYEVFERTATIENFTITSPSDWYLVNQWPLGAQVATSTESSSASCITHPFPGEPDMEVCGGVSAPVQVSVTDAPPLPLMMLSNADLGLGTSPCLEGGIDLAGGTAVLEVAIDAQVVQQIEAGTGPSLPAWPVAFDEDTVTDGPCGSGHYVRFKVGRYPYIAWVGFGPEASDDVRRDLFSMVGEMKVDEGSFLLGSSDETPGYVIAGGENAAGPWRLELRPSTSDGPEANVDLHLIGSEGGGPGMADFTVPDATPIESGGGDPMFGVVTKEATGVELRLEEGTPPIPATLVPLPPTFAHPFDVFFASSPSDVPAEAVALGIGVEVTTSPPGGSSEGSELRRVATGVIGGTAWALDYEEGRQLALVGDGDDILFHRIGGNHMASLSREKVLIGTHDFGTSGEPRYLLYGVTHHEVDQLSIVFDDGRVISLGRGTLRDLIIHIFGRNPNISPGVWWAEMPPGPVVARIDAFDTSCTEISSGGVVLQPPSADTSITAQADCVEGG